jgi:flagellar hook-length control protein FliK
VPDLHRPAGRAGRNAADSDAGEGSDAHDTSGAAGSPSRLRSGGRAIANDASSAQGAGSIGTEGANPAAPAEPAALGTGGASRADPGAQGPASDLQSLATPPAPLATATAAPLAAAEPGRADGPTPTLALPTPVDSPQFAGALGIQVSVLAKGGVQHAELHLNPAEMGPVSIRIELDGSEAQVQFGADLEQTRQAIERGLPELASALRDAGFTLSGGGVSQHARQRGGADGEGEGSDTHRSGAAGRHADADASGTKALRAARHVAAGGVDVYA